MIQVNNGSQFFIGVVEDRADPLALGRTRVRVVGLHNHDKQILKTEDLPWAMMMQPPGMGRGNPAVPPAEGTTVVVIFNDFPACQQPIIIGKMAGIPQGTPVNIDKFEESPLFKDDITPQGRKVPTTDLEVDGGQRGPIVAPNPALEQIVAQSQQTSVRTPLGVVQSVMQPVATTVGAVGGMVGSIASVGSTIAIAKNTFEDLLLNAGNIDVAVERFKVMATQSGPLGSAVSALLNGKASLKQLERDYGYSLDSINSSIRSIKDVNLKDPLSVLSAFTSADQILAQVGSTVTGVGGVLGAIEGELAEFTVEGTIAQLGDDAANLVGSITGEVTGVISAGVQQVEAITDIFNIGSVTGATQATLSSLSGTASTYAAGLFSSVAELGAEFGLNNPLAKAANVAAAIQDEYSAARDALVDNVGNITALASAGGKLPGQVTQKDFAKVPEGSTPPIRGAYGGPNFSGADPVITKPTIDDSRYAGGAKDTINIPAEPPSYWSGDRVRASAGIRALLAACDKYGLKTREAKATLLGIVGGECGWIPRSETYQYSDPSYLATVFKSTFSGKRSLAEKYANWEIGKKGTREEFFDFVYDPANSGRQVGNTLPGDGAKYYGRGYIHVIGRANYERYTKMSGYDLVNNPELLNDTAIGAEIAVLFIMDRKLTRNTPTTAHPGYFYAAKKAIGNNIPSISERKLQYYEYFYGIKTPEGYRFDELVAGNTQSPNSYQGSMGGNDADKPAEGFRDPHRKYPLNRRVYEAETARLARGITKETIVDLKNSQRVLAVDTAMNGESWAQPPIPYGAKYPYNYVQESESGHVMEIDDTPGYERLHRYHRTGTFEEIDAQGTRVVRIVGDGYTILDRNGYIFIAGDANITTVGNINILCQSDVNIEVEGSAEMKVGGSMDIGVAKDMNIAVQGDFSLWANGAMNLQSKGNSHIRSNDTMFVSSNKEIHVLSESNTLLSSKGKLDILSAGDARLSSASRFDIAAADTMKIATANELNINSSGSTKASSGGVIDFMSSGDFNVDSSKVYLNSGKATAADQADPAAAATKALIHGMVPPPPGVPAHPRMESLKGPEPHGEEQFMYEEPGASDTQASQQYHDEYIAQNGLQNTYESESATPTGGSDWVTPNSRRDEILAMEVSDFTASFKLSEHFTLGMLFDGGFNVKHKLRPQRGLSAQEIVCNMASLCENILEKYLEVLPGGINGMNKTWRISSGFRNGYGTSDHELGRACDIILLPYGNDRKKRTFDLAKKVEPLIPYDQMILEYRGSTSVWIHTSFRGNGIETFGSSGTTNRKTAFTMVNDRTYADGFKLLA